LANRKVLSLTGITFAHMNRPLDRFCVRTRLREKTTGENHRYRRPRLLTVMYSMTHATRQHEHSKWRLNRSKIIERDREKPCFSHFTPAYCFRSRSTTLFGEELTGVKVLDEYLYNLSSIKTK
jgi:hypothetical protein